MYSLTEEINEALGTLFQSGKLQGKLIHINYKGDRLSEIYRESMILKNLIYKVSSEREFESSLILLHDSRFKVKKLLNITSKKVFGENGE